MAAVGYAAQAGLFLSALQLMDASLLSLILYTYPVLVTVTAVMLGRDRLAAGRSAALVAASGGTLLVLLGAGGVNFHPLGALLAFGSAITYTIYILVADTGRGRDPRRGDLPGVGLQPAGLLAWRAAPVSRRTGRKPI
ncbi:hypothetical protein [Micromonospora sp. 4G55]|uniref:hypothetical protein n=1 Tax=Micromonospora sp. 4G55 TaxID=2806102 RepID=UPI001EE484E6|nr:hypothetical protein [Micromonospora sp. 4G55]